MDRMNRPRPRQICQGSHLLLIAYTTPVRWKVVPLRYTHSLTAFLWLDIHLTTIRLNGYNSPFPHLGLRRPINVPADLSRSSLVRSRSKSMCSMSE